jgi:hypothetical protein
MPTSSEIPTSAPTSKRPRRWPYIAAIPLALAVGIGIGGQRGDPTQTAASSPPTIAAVQPAPRGTYSAAAATPTGPLTSFSDGIYEVGTGPGQIAPGKYRSDNPNGNGYIWLTKADGGYGDDASSKGQILVTIKTTDVRAEVYGCTFTKV